MANFFIGGSPAFSTFWNFSTSFGTQLAFSTVISRLWPNDDSFYDISAMSSYRNSNFFRYNVTSNNSGFGNVQLLSPFVSARTSSVLTPWFRVGNPPFITITATPFYPRRFLRWQDGNGTILSFNQTYSVGWSDTGTLDLVAIFG
jgi:hypothetical protein